MKTIELSINNVTIKDALKIAERDIYQQAIVACRYNQSKTARLLGVSRGTIRKKLKEYMPEVFEE